ncbi:hypothetical protein [Gymnodinialimonas ulvae]|uniref:hypothetical protein n=1 Tax=Gymnodinialimonas ulvae TaxID=3126504 RepID=UPI00309F8416
MWIFFCLPGFVALLALGMDWQAGFGVATLGATTVALILLGHFGKWPALTLMRPVWLVSGLGIAVTFPSWAVAIGTLLLVWLASLAAVRFGRGWGHARYRRLETTGRGIRERLFIGAEYLTDHRLNRLSIELCLSALAVGLASELVAFDLLMGMARPREVALIVVFVSPIWLILARRPVACPMVIGVFIAACVVQSPALIGLLLPVLVYWIDGAWPNLIYRHRFERMPSNGECDVR